MTDYAALRQEIMQAEQDERARIDDIRQAHYAAEAARKAGAEVVPPSDADAEIERLRARIIAMGGKPHHKAGLEKLQEAFNAMLDDTSEGLSRREIIADLESAGVEFDPYAPREELLKLHAQAKADAKAAAGAAG